MLQPYKIVLTTHIYTILFFCNIHALILAKDVIEWWSRFCFLLCNIINLKNIRNRNAKWIIFNQSAESILTLSNRRRYYSSCVYGDIRNGKQQLHLQAQDRTFFCPIFNLIKSNTTIPNRRSDKPQPVDFPNHDTSTQ